MSLTSVSDLSNQVQEFWSPVFKDELIESHPLINLVNREFEGDMKKGGDTVYVSTIQRVDAERKTVGAGADSFSSSTLTTSRVAVVANQRVTASVELEDLAMLQSQIGDQESKLRQSLLESVQIEMNNYLYSLVNASAASPDHVESGITDFNASQLGVVRKLAAQAQWKRDEWYCLLDPSYYNDVLNSTNLVSSDMGATDAPVIAGQVGMKRFGFNLLEDTSAGLLTLQTGTEDAGLAFHPDFMYLAVQREPTFQLSSLHANKQHGFLLSVDLVCGAVQADDTKVIEIYNS